MNLINFSIKAELINIPQDSSINKRAENQKIHLFSYTRRVQTHYIRMDRHNKVRCLVCGRCMRSNNLKRHMKIHKELLSMPENEAREEIRVRHAAEIEREAKRQKFIELALQEGVSIPKEIMQASPAFDTGNLEESMLKDNREYLKKIELGMQITLIIDEEDIHEESLRKDYKHALDLYRKQRLY